MEENKNVYDYLKEINEKVDDIQENTKKPTKSDDNYKQVDCQNDSTFQNTIEVDKSSEQYDLHKKEEYIKKIYEEMKSSKLYVYAYDKIAFRRKMKNLVKKTLLFSIPSFVLAFFLFITQINSNLDLVTRIVACVILLIPTITNIIIYSCSKSFNKANTFFSLSRVKIIRSQYKIEFVPKKSLFSYILIIIRIIGFVIYVIDSYLIGSKIVSTTAMVIFPSYIILSFFSLFEREYNYYLFENNGIFKYYINDHLEDFELYDFK